MAAVKRNSHAVDAINQRNPRRHNSTTKIITEKTLELIVGQQSLFETSVERNRVSPELIDLARPIHDPNNRHDTSLCQ